MAARRRRPGKLPAVSSPFGPLVIIVNPMSGRGRVAAEIPEIERTLQGKGLEYRILLTQGPGDATRFAREALTEGTRFVVAVGGDGTVHEVVNGMVEDDRPVIPDAVLGVVAAGSGCDFVRTFGLPGDATRAVAHLTGENLFPLDIGKVRYVDPDGKQSIRYFPNIAEAGLGGATVTRAARLPRFFGRSRYFFGFWLTLPRYKPGNVTVQTDRKTYEGRGVNIVVANCQYFGGGMRISPRSYPGDGALDVLIFRGPKSDSFTTIPKVYKGEHVPHPNIVEMKGTTVIVEAEQPLRIEADGEVLGTTPATFQVLPQIVNLKI
jgi:diacylglycerol kinase (ATP)